jgi:hypothetical protein
MVEPSAPIGLPVKVTVLVKVPLKITPLGSPSAVLLLLIVKLPPLLNDETKPAVDMYDPVEKLTDPRAPELVKPLTEVRLEPVKVSPEELPESVPPALLKSTLLAKAAIGKARVSKAIKTIRFMIKSS